MALVSQNALLGLFTVGRDSPRRPRKRDARRRQRPERRREGCLRRPGAAGRDEGLNLGIAALSSREGNDQGNRAGPVLDQELLAFADLSQVRAQSIFQIRHVDGSHGTPESGSFMAIMAISVRRSTNPYMTPATP